MMDREYEAEYWARYNTFKEILKENPDGLLNYITRMDEELEYIKHILKTKKER